MKPEPMPFGTKEWAPHTFNYVSGCTNDCVYCYAKEMAIRFKRKNADTWHKEEPVSLEGRSFKKRDGTIMIPSSHDITLSNLDQSIQILSKLLQSGNHLLVVTKAHPLCIERLVKEFVQYRDNIEIRFTIGSASSSVLRIWEPNAPSFENRLQALHYTFDAGFATSVSSEPLLDEHFDEIYKQVAPFITAKIWVGKMNSAHRRVRINSNGAFDEQLLDELVASQSDEKILALYERYKDDPKIAWKESIKKVMIQNGHCSEEWNDEKD
jgi:DNA repair photolyase